jgi:hypothetical protein
MQDLSVSPTAAGTIVGAAAAQTIGGRAIMRRRTLRPENAKVVCSAAREIRSSRP